MLTILLILTLLSNAVTLRRDKSILFSRIVISGLICTAYISYSNLYVKALESGIGLFGGLFNISTFTQTFNIFIFIISALILTLTAFYPRKIYLTEHSSIYGLVCSLKYSPKPSVFANVATESSFYTFGIVLPILWAAPTLLISIVTKFQLSQLGLTHLTFIFVGLISVVSLFVVFNKNGKEITLKHVIHRFLFAIMLFLLFRYVINIDIGMIVCLAGPSIDSMLNHSSDAGETAAGGRSGHGSGSGGDDNNGDKDEDKKGKDNKGTNNSDNPFRQPIDVSSGPALADSLTRRVDYLISFRDRHDIGHPRNGIITISDLEVRPGTVEFNMTTKALGVRSGTAHIYSWLIGYNRMRSIREYDYNNNSN